MTNDEIYQRGFSQEYNGEVDREYFRGICYAQGICVERNSQMAKECYERGNSLANAKCKYGLAIMTQRERQKSADVLGLFQEAFPLLLTEANSGDPISQRMVSCYYLFGDRGIEKNLDAAKEWLVKAADGGDSEAQMNLGHCLEVGEFFDADIESAILWYARAAEQGNAKATKMMDKLKGERK